MFLGRQLHGSVLWTRDLTDSPRSWLSLGFLGQGEKHIGYVKRLRGGSLRTAPEAFNYLLRESLGFWVQDEVVVDGHTLAVFGWDWIQHQFWFDCRGDVVIVVWITWEVQLGGQQLVTWSLDLQVQVSWTPGVPAGSSDQLTAGTISWDLVRRRLNRVHLKFSVVVNNPGATQIPLGNARSKLRVEAIIVRVPHFNLGILQRSTIGRTNLTVELHRSAWFIFTHWDGAIPWQFWCVFDVVRTFNGALVTFAVTGGNFFDRVLEPDVEEQWPFAIFADLDEPSFEGVVLVVADALFNDDVVECLDCAAGQQVNTFGIDHTVTGS